ncbi:MAG: hypothetical protein JOZ83_12830, partial [Silvibacterium sp.]|nr:hypothetical protein [Silvibacterium sp.]
EFGLPVRRPNGIEHKSPVAAHPGDLDAWLQTRWSARNTSGSPGKQVSANGFKFVHTDLAEAIRISQELRVAHQSLISETRLALEALHATLVTCALPREGEE